METNTEIAERFSADLEFVIAVLSTLLAMFFTVFVLARLRQVGSYFGLVEATTTAKRPFKKKIKK